MTASTHRTSRRGRLLALLVAIIVLGSAGAAFAFFTAGANGNGAALAGSLSAPSGFTAVSTGSTTAQLSWTAPANVTSYTLSQSPGSIAGCSATPTSGTTSCTATGLTAATAYTWTLTAVFHNWSSASVQTGTTTDTGVGPATKLVFTQPPSSSTGGVAFATQPKVTVQDAAGNTVTTDSSTVTLSITALTPTSGGPGTLSGCTQTESAGVISFSGCKIDTAGTGYQLHAVDGALTPADSSAFNVTVGTATQLAFTQPLSSSTGGVAFATQPKVTVQDAGGNAVTTDSSTVTLSITALTPTSGGPGTLSGCTQTETLGVVTFSGCKIDTAGTGYKLHATDGGLTPADSNAFNVTVGTATNFLVTPSTSTPNAGSSFTVTLTARDAGGNTVTSYTGSHTITWSGATTSPGGNAPSYPVSAVSFTNGVSTTTLTATLFSAGANTLTASASSPTVTGSAAITVSGLTASVMKLTNCVVQGNSQACNGSYHLGLGGSMTADVTLTDAYGNVPPPTSLSMNVTSLSPSTYSVSGSPITITGGTVSTTFTVTKLVNPSTSATITIHATSGSYTDLTFTVAK
jgi:hypothetical protein